MDGTTYKLPNVIAYEVFENDQWSTKIVATKKTVKQDTLLARLRKTGTDMDEDGSPPDWPQPYLVVELDEDDTPWRLNLQADGTPGGGRCANTRVQPASHAPKGTSDESHEPP